MGPAHTGRPRWPSGTPGRRRASEGREGLTRSEADAPGHRTASGHGKVRQRPLGGPCPRERHQLETKNFRSSANITGGEITQGRSGGQSGGRSDVASPGLSPETLKDPPAQNRGLAWLVQRRPHRTRGVLPESLAEGRAGRLQSVTASRVLFPPGDRAHERTDGRRQGQLAQKGARRPQTQNACQNAHDRGVRHGFSCALPHPHFGATFAAVKPQDQGLLRLPPEAGPAPQRRGGLGRSCPRREPLREASAFAQRRPDALTCGADGGADRGADPAGGGPNDGPGSPRIRAARRWPLTPLSPESPPCRGRQTPGLGSGRRGPRSRTRRARAAAGKGAARGVFAARARRRGRPQHLRPPPAPSAPPDPRPRRQPRAHAHRGEAQGRGRTDSPGPQPGGGAAGAGGRRGGGGGVLRPAPRTEPSGPLPRRRGHCSGRLATRPRATGCPACARAPAAPGPPAPPRRPRRPAPSPPRALIGPPPARPSPHAHWPASAPRAPAPPPPSPARPRPSRGARRVGARSGPRPGAWGKRQRAARSWVGSGGAEHPALVTGRHRAAFPEHESRLRPQPGLEASCSSARGGPRLAGSVQ
ncbi:collagen alpha-1(I) chain-like [Enhydra lutris kenyoni]|uniref:Collagen alpha-1(I) chain-like n=1 Tax=Enhydra lutris kenyoni TaxID=391180 RepID=A0A2Y9K955_ENHLU|nr:collagen alpha-1(I) chain-like [Enhydra lutris kenyoni]